MKILVTGATGFTGAWILQTMWIFDSIFYIKNKKSVKFIWLSTRIGLREHVGDFLARQKGGLFLSVFAFWDKHSPNSVTEKRRKPTEKEPFLAWQENPQHALIFW